MKPSNPHRHHNKIALKKLGGSDRSRSVGDFLLEVDEAIRPLIDLVGLLDEAAFIVDRKEYHVPYREMDDAKRARLRINGLLERGMDDPPLIEISRAMSNQYEHPSPVWRLSLPASLLDNDKIPKRLNGLIEQREAIARAIERGDLANAQQLRVNVMEDLYAHKLAVRVPENLLADLEHAFEKLPKIAALGTAEDRIAYLPLMVAHVMQEAAKNTGVIGVKTPAERLFVDTVKAIADDVYMQRDGIGRSDSPAEATHYFPKDLPELIKQGYEHGYGHVRMQTPAAHLLGPYLQGPDLSTLYTGQAQPKKPDPSGQPKNYVNTVIPSAGKLAPPLTPKGRTSPK